MEAVYCGKSAAIGAAPPDPVSPSAWAGPASRTSLAWIWGDLAPSAWVKAATPVHVPTPVISCDKGDLKVHNVRGIMQAKKAVLVPPPSVQAPSAWSDARSRQA